MLSISIQIALKWMSQRLTGHKSTMLQVMAYWHLVTSQCLKPLSHQVGVLTACKKNSGRRGVSWDAMLRRVFCACIKYAPWLGVPTAIRMSVVGTPWVRSGNAVIAQWGLLERHDDAVRTQRERTWSPQECRCRRRRLHGDLLECMEMSLRLYCVLTVRLRCLHCAYIEYRFFHCALMATTQSCHSDHCDPMALPRSPSAFAGHLHGPDTATTVRCQLRFTKENGTQAILMNV